MDISTLTGVSNWLTVIPIQNFDSNYLSSNSRIQQDSDMVGKTCNLPTSRPCGSKFDIQHGISCKKGGFIYIRPLIRHNDLRDLTENMMLEVCKDIETEPKLIPLSGEELQARMSNNSNESINGSIGRQCQKFYSRLAQMISEKKDLPLLISSNWIRTKVCSRLLKSSLHCLRGSKTACRKTAEFEIDVDVSHTLAKI